MLEHLNTPSEEDAESSRLILLVVNDAQVGTFLAHVIKREMAHHVMLASHDYQALKIAREIKPDLFLLDYELACSGGFALYEQLHATKGLERVPAILCSIGTRFPRYHLKRLYHSNGRKSSELENFLHTIQEVLA